MILLTSLISLDVENRKFPKYAPILQCREHRFAIVANYAKLASLHNVHLFTDIAFAADVVAWAKHLKYEILKYLLSRCLTTKEHKGLYY